MFKLVPKSYLRGLDGVLPEGTREPVSAAQPPTGTAQALKEGFLRQAPRERADGRGQFDYLSRLAGDLAAMDAAERREGRAGVRAIGVLGNDVYDRLLVLEALRRRFPEAIFFTTDLDARMMGADVTEWTRNLVVASAYGLTLNPRIQGSAPPFRDTYQAGLYLSTLVALNRGTQALDTADLKKWFALPQLFEIGRTRAVPLSKGAEKECDGDLRRCENVHRLDEWPRFPWPQPSTLFALAIGTLTAVLLSLLVSEGSRRAMRGIKRYGWAIAGGFGLVVVALALFCYRIWNGDVRTYQGEPFAWLEGVSIWPTVLFQVAVFGVIAGLVWWYCLRKLSKDIDDLAEGFGLQKSSAVSADRRPQGRLIELIHWLWWLDPLRAAGSGREVAPAQGAVADPWLEFVHRMRRREQITRIAAMSILAFVLSVALISVDWPNSPHRGAFSAWSNHITSLLILLGLMAILFAVFDASAMATRFMDRLEPRMEMLPVRELNRDGFWKSFPMEERVIRLCTWFRVVVRLGSAVNGLIYLPAIALLLVIPARARVFGAWTFPLSYGLLFFISGVLAVFCAVRLRRTAARLRKSVTTALDERIATYKLEADLAPHRPAAAVAAPEQDVDWNAMPPEAKAKRIEELKDEILAEREGPFRALAEDPIIRAFLLLVGGTGAISTAEFLFLTTR